MTDGRYTLGVVSVSFRGYSPKEIIKAAANANLSVIEWGSDVHAPASDREALRRIAALQSEYGITTSSYGSYFRLGVNGLSELYSYAEAARLLGTDIIRVWCGNKSGADMTKDERKSLIDECKGAAKIAEECGVILCTECHRATFTEMREDAVFLMNEVASQGFRTYWQPFQWQSHEENLLNAEALSPYATHLHVFNWRDSEKLPLADAVEDWQKYLKKFDTPRTLLLEFMPNDGIDELKAEADALRKIIGE